jgi:hypothetical protein
VSPARSTPPPRGGSAEGKVVRAVFHVPPRPKAGPKAAAPPAPVAGDRIDRLEVIGSGARESVALESPLLSTLMTGGREKRRKIPINVIPQHMLKAVLAIEDKRFYEHPGVDVLRSAKAIFTNLSGDRLPTSWGAARSRSNSSRTSSWKPSWPTRSRSRSAGS